MFSSHCGIGALLESIYFVKSVVCMPFNMEQFSNEIAIMVLNVGKSSFVQPLAWELFWYSHLM